MLKEYLIYKYKEILSLGNYHLKCHATETGVLKYSFISQISPIEYNSNSDINAHLATKKKTNLHLLKGKSISTAYLL